ncbi:SNF2 family N-terminal domain-containing protein [Diaporthe sp. PMI_573]|nr:SNF2 family N-terminal domain-containing protein [Diaporthaceae sp. PMI_573]
MPGTASIILQVSMVYPDGDGGGHGDDADAAVIRVHVLPDDSFNSLIPRDDPVLRGKKKALLASLDYSPSTWRGSSKHFGAPLSFPRISPQNEAARSFPEDDGSLLALFNNIPSPEPDTTLIQDHVSREAMANLLSSTVKGLETELYPYQCRSAAMMLQKEEEPGEILDPRLVHVVDQHGKSWYYDSNTGEARREPRRYDQICGGILAEEMGSGKTLISLALIAATKDQPAVIPEIFRHGNRTVRPKVGSLMDMAASVATKSGVSWKRYIDSRYENCVRAIERNPGWYHLPRSKGARMSRRTTGGINLPPTKIFVSHTTLIIVPPDLLRQWTQEISKHMQGLRVLEIASKKISGAVSNEIPSTDDLIHCDVVICTATRLETIWTKYKRPEADGSHSMNCSLGQVQFKRCIVDEGHKLGNIRVSSVRTDLLQALEALHVNARWIVTGTPAKGLFGVEKNSDSNTSLARSSTIQESEDLKRIGSIATFYLKARPWSNTTKSHHDTLTDWKTYMVQGRKDCLASTFNSLIIRHQLSEISHMLPAVDSKIVKLEGSYQDKLCMNIFSMMIIFNAVQSQRTDQDYFFHPRNRKAMLELVNNLRQAIFFGGSFFSEAEIQKSVETAESFLGEKFIPVNESDETLLSDAINLGKLAIGNKIKRAANIYHEMPIYVDQFPGGPPTAWSTDDKASSGPICTNWKLMIAAQRTLRPYLGSIEDLITYLNSGSFLTAGVSAQGGALRDAQPPQSPSLARNAEKTLAGNTKLGEDHVNPRRGHLAAIKLDEKGIPTPPQTPQEDIEIAAPLAETRLISTVSAKLSYLIDAIAVHQKEEQIIVFYDNDNIAWYLAGVLEMLQIHHLIYAKGISVDRRARYVSTFTHSRKFRVLLMDISEAAFGLDMKSASRIYFISPVLDPQVEAQAIGRVRRISQRKRVTVETLVLRGSIEELIVERKMKMTQAEHRRCKTILDDRPIYDWILNARIIPLPDVSNDDGPAQMVPLAVPQYIFGREFGREVVDPDEDILPGDPSHTAASPDKAKRKRSAEDDDPDPDGRTDKLEGPEGKRRNQTRPAKRARFAGVEDNDSDASVVHGQLAASSSTRPAVDIPRDSQSPLPDRPAKRARFADM